MIRRFYHYSLNRLFASYAFREHMFSITQQYAARRLHAKTTMLCPPAELPAEYGLRPSKASVPRNRALFVTARFRTGSTFLWQVLNHLPEVHAYYEPLNPIGWFSVVNPVVDPTHIGVSDYAASYRGLSHLSALFDPRWASEDLYMDETHYDPRLARYIAKLINCSSRLAALACNRIDFRLPWLKVTFPDVPILHLYRHPRDQWMSILYQQEVPREVTVTQFRSYDRFYLLEWARDLSRSFPFLQSANVNRHPYELHYLIWRLSYDYGRSYADLSISYEGLLSDLSGHVLRILKLVGINGPEIGEELESLKARPRNLETWRTYAPDAWFEDIEGRCEEIMQRCAAAERG
jgi:hypothetical protein